ncbi:MAG: hypothetical protein AAGC55_16940, partial [Myxococcota bacterium]
MKLYRCRETICLAFLAAMILANAGCGDDGGSSDDTGDTDPDAGDTVATTCSSVVISDEYPDATDTGPCTSEAGLAIADSLLNLDGVTIDNNGTAMTPCIAVQCDADYAYIISNGLPHYDFVQTTPNELAEDTSVYRIPLTPTPPVGTNAVEISSLTGCQDAYAAYVSGEATEQEPAGLCTDGQLGYLTEELLSGTVSYGQIACLGAFGTTISGVNVNGPNEAVFPDPWGDPAFRYPDSAA